MLRYTTLGSKIILGVFLSLAATAAYLPFLEAFALTPAIAFIHRFSITLNIGDSTKTLQPIIFVIPILLIKGLWEYNRKYGLKQLFTSNLTKIIAFLVIIDLISLLTTTDRGESLSVFIAHGMNFAIFITATIWLKLVSDLLSSETAKKVATKLLTTFGIALAVFTIVNSTVSISQFFDCSLSNSGCHAWRTIDETFPNKLLLVGHQKFSYKPNIIRAPGLFGDVNFNGMFSLLVLILFGTIWITAELLKTPKGYAPQKMQRLILIPMGAALISFALTFSRSALLGAGVTGIILLLAYVIPLAQKLDAGKMLLKNLWKPASLTVIALITLFLLGYLVPLNYGARKTSLSGEIARYVKTVFSPNDKSAQGHANLFESAIIIGNQRPLLGMGMGTFGVQYQKLIRPDSDTNASPHSTYGLLYAEQGLVGLLGYLLVVGYLWYLSMRTLRKFAQKLVSYRATEKKLTREFLWESRSELLLILVSLGIPFFSIATVSYYGFFLPMAWWWGNHRLLEDS